MNILLIRHGQTKGNLEKRYIGCTDEELCPEGIHNLLEKAEKGIYRKADKIFISPMKRCVMSAELLYPNQEVKLCHDFRECNFGEFENKNYLELSENKEYQSWIDSGGVLPFPKGESSENFKKRCQREYERIIEEYLKETDLTLAFIIHGGTIMSILEKYALPQKEFYHWQLGNGEGYFCRLIEETMNLEVIEKLG